MKKFLFIFISLLISTITVAQIADTIVVRKNYTSYFSFKYRNPVFVVYKLYKGGGDVPRTGMYFKSDVRNTLTSEEYAKSGFDKGHLVNAEDFAYNYDLEKATFDYINALPQIPGMNRGAWKSLESAIRKQSQTDSLLIIAGGYEFKQFKPGFFVPAKCFKIVKNLKTKTVVYYDFENAKIDNMKTVEGNITMLPDEIEKVILKIIK